MAAQIIPNNLLLTYHFGNLGRNSAKQLVGTLPAVVTLGNLHTYFVCGSLGLDVGRGFEGAKFSNHSLF